MEHQTANQLQTNTMNQSIVKHEPVAVLKTIARANLVVSFPFSDIQIEDWMKNIIQMRPETTTEELNLVMDKFLDGRCKWNHKESLSNIFRGLNLLKLEPKEYYCEEKRMKYRIYGSVEQGNKRFIYENDKEF